MTINPLNLESKKLCDAFKHYKEHLRLTWKQLSDKLKGSEIDFPLGDTTLEGLFGIGGKRSPVVKHNYGNANHYKKQLKIVKVLNNYVQPKIELDADGKPVYGEDGYFRLIIEDGVQVEEKIEPEEFLVFYWRHDDQLGEALLTLHKNKKLSAGLEISYSHKPHIYLIGEYQLLKEIVSINLYDRDQKNEYPQTHISYFRGSQKHCYFAGFSTSHRGDDKLPVAGKMLLFHKEKAVALPDNLSIKDLATFLLSKKRFQMSSGGFDLHTDKLPLESDCAEVNAYLQLVKYAGIYTGTFVNPKKKTYETCVIKINKTGEVQLLVDANVEVKPFWGVARIFKENKVLIISYDYKKEIEDYRMKLFLDVSSYHFDDKNVFGVMSGLEYLTETIMSSTFAIKRITKEDEDIFEYKDEIKVIHLDDKKASQNAFKKDAKARDLYDYFIGKKNEQFVSVSLLNKLTNSQ